MTPTALRIAFAGTPEFAAVSLKALIDQGFSIVGVVTQPDRPAGRKRKLTPSAVKKVALEHDLPLYQPEHLETEDTHTIIEDWQPDLLIVAAFGMILTQRMLDLPRFGCLNVHASLLPRWRGAAPIQRAIEAGDAETGVCIMQMDAGLDTGPVAHEKKIAITNTTTASSLHDELAALGAQALTEALEKFCSDQWHLLPQPQEGATYAKKLSREDGHIIFDRPSHQVHQHIQAMSDRPGAFIKYQGQMIGVAQPEVLSLTKTLEAGTILAYDKTGLDIATLDGVIRLHQLKIPGKTFLSVRDLYNGRADLFQEGDRLEP